MSSQNSFKNYISERGLEIKPTDLETLWVNITNSCNQSCRHCHIGASPEGRENMDRAIIDRCLDVLARHHSIINLDITGGAPELNPDFEYFVVEGRRLGKNVKVRHNLSVTLDGNPATGSNKNHLPGFFAENRVQVLASLPHYEEEFVDAIRGRGVFKKSIRALTMLNEAGYGNEKTGLLLDLVCNVDGPITTAGSKRLEDDFRRAIWNNHGINFNGFLCVTNMPINRYRALLNGAGNYEDYMAQMIEAFNPDAIQNLVCRKLVSVGYDGRLYDCDFNLALGLQAVPRKADIFNFDLEALLNREISLGNHCFGCTAGGGSS